MNAKTKTIEIDFDVYKVIINNSKHFNESANDVLRRLLNISSSQVTSIVSNVQTNTGGLMVKNVFLPAGMKLRKYFKGSLLQAEVHDGFIEYNGKRYTSPSGAAVDAAGGSVNGWRFWEYLDTKSNTWKVIDTLKGN